MIIERLIDLMKWVVLGEVIIFISIVAGVIFWKRWMYIPTGRVKGVCVKVETEISSLNREYNDGHIDNRLYRPTIQYEYDGACYVAKSVIAYNSPKYFPGDEVVIMINNRNREYVRIMKVKQNVPNRQSRFKKAPTAHIKRGTRTFTDRNGE